MSHRDDCTQAILPVCLKFKAQQISSRTRSQTQAVCCQSPCKCGDRKNFALSSKCFWPEPLPSEVSLHTSNRDMTASPGSAAGGCPLESPLGFLACGPLVSRRSSPSPWPLHCQCLPLEPQLLHGSGPGLKDFVPMLTMGDKGFVPQPKAHHWALLPFSVLPLSALVAKHTR